MYSMYTTHNYKRLRLEGIDRTVEFETEKVNKEIARMELGAVSFASSGKLSYDAQSLEIGEASVLEYLRGFIAAEGGGFWFEPYGYNPETFRSGVYAYIDQNTGEFVLDQSLYTDGILNLEDYDYHGFNWYGEIISTVTKPYQVAWTKPYYDDSGSFSLMTTAGAGIFDQDGNIIGVSTIDWKIEDVIAQLSAIKPTENSFVLLCVPEQDYIISNTYTRGGTGESIKTLGWDINADTFTLDDVTYKTFERVMDNGWFLSVQIPVKEIFVEIESQNRRFSSMIAGAFLVLLLLASYLLSRIINRPLRKLTSGVARLGNGNLEQQIDIDTKDEIGTLAAAFNKMTVDLKASIEESSRERAEKERIGAELDVATKIQAGMLPCIFPAFPHRHEFDLYATMLPAKEVGGDFYDFFLIDENTLAIVIADVSGKGVPAALFMVITKTLIKNNSQSGKSPKEVFETVNNILCENNEAGMFVTAFLGYLHIPSGRFTFVNAGHNPPLLRSNGYFNWLKAKHGFVLAGMEDVLYTQDEILLQQGDELFLYTDGVTEAVNDRNELFGDMPLLEAVNNFGDLSLKELTLSIKQEIDQFADGAEQADDITILVLRYKGEQRMNELSIEAKSENLDTVLDFINTQIGDCPGKIQNQIGIAVDEIFSNIARYAYHPGVGGATVRIVVGEDIMIEFEDAGTAYNPLSSDDPDVSLPAEERKIGGLGILLVKNLMDSVEYWREGEKNILVIKKKL